MKAGGVIQYEPEVPYFKHCFFFRIYHIPLYLPLLVRQMPKKISYFTNLSSKKTVTSAAFFFL